MGTFRCIYSGKDWDEQSRSDEHIVPFSIGGSNQFVTRDVARLPNNDIGTRVDGPLVNSWFFTVERWRLKLESEDGHIPPLVFPGTVEINGRTVRARHSINPDGSASFATIPEVGGGFDEGKFDIACDPKDMLKILGNIKKKAKKRGLTLTDLTGAEIKDKTLAIQNPKLNVSMAFDTLALVPCFIKIALATGHLVLGYSWSNCSDADVLRQGLSATTPEDWARLKVPGYVWPAVPNSLITGLMGLGSDKHVIAVLNTNPLSAYILLFGQFEGCIRLMSGVREGRELPPGDGKVFVIDCKSRVVSQYGYREYIGLRTLKRLT